jgi:prevent-host-death family protein
MSKVFSIDEVKARLSELVEEAASGKEIVTARAGIPRARLVPLRDTRRPRLPGLGKGRIWIAHDFDAPLPPELKMAFTATAEPEES